MYELQDTASRYEYVSVLQGASRNVSVRQSSTYSKALQGIYATLRYVRGLEDASDRYASVVQDTAVVQVAPRYVRKLLQGVNTTNNMYFRVLQGTSAYFKVKLVR